MEKEENAIETSIYIYIYIYAEIGSLDEHNGIKRKDLTRVGSRREPKILARQRS